ncbi:MAG: hypothetical protein JW934_08350 [Anaerolineae bacterium]|nr:hypothetical protein [Anaerolineae bacterium]
MAVDKAAMNLVEQTLRRELGIPSDAERVLVFAESSHWDPNWLYTSEAYYQRFVQGNLDRAIEALQREPRRVYSVECMFFLRMYWDRCPEKQETLRALLNEGRMRLTGSGVTTADTLLPSAEAILRDFLIGQEWLRANGIAQEPRLAYFTDSFGCSASLPTLLRAAGFDRTALTRIDGMHFVGCDFEPARNFPRPGSTAEYLQNELKTLDFIWRDANGAEVLCHWNAFSYGQGDMLAFRGISRIYIVPFAWSDHSERLVARRITQFVAQLDPLRHTPYMFCPIGFDFVPPIADLVALLDRYNRVRYPSTGVWAVNAGLDDYLTLVECHRDRLPTVQIDPNPYWSGFYTARPSLKKRCRALVDQLRLAERLTLLPQNQETAGQINAELDEAWWDAVSSNHHDFITGTSPDAVVEQEQIPWLKRASQAAQSAIRRLSPHTPQIEMSVVAPNHLPTWQRQDEMWTVSTPHYALELDGASSCIARAWRPETEQPLLAGLSNDLVSYHDSGGLWRMGCEFRGGKFEVNARASVRSLHCQVNEDGGILRAICDAGLDGMVVRRSLWFDNASPLIRGCVEGRAPDNATVTVRLATGLFVTHLAMGEPGGVAIRPLRRFYEPTFWPVQEFVHLYDESAECGMAVLLPLPTAVSCTPEGVLELIALRNANRERAFGFLPIPANPAAGHERESYAFEYALFFTSGGDWRENSLPAMTHQFKLDLARARGLGALVETVNALVQVDPPATIVSALKPAARGEGIIVRLINQQAVGQEVTLAMPGREIQQAFLCDARERDLESLPVEDGQVRCTLAQPIVTLRVIAKWKESE